MNVPEKKSTFEWSKQVENVILWATVIISIAVAILDFSGALDNIQWLSDRIPTFILLGVGFLAGYLALERRSQLEAMHTELKEALNKLAVGQDKATQTLIESLQGVQVRKFDNGHELLRYMYDLVAKSQVRIDDLSWRATFTTRNYGDFAHNMGSQYVPIMQDAVQRVPYREIMIFNKPGRKERFQSLITDNKPGYSCAYYQTDTEIPLLQFMIIDLREVIIFEDLAANSICISHPLIAKYFADYYEEIWQKAVKLKLGKTVYWDAVREVLGDEATEALVPKPKF